MVVIIMGVWVCSSHTGGRLNLRRGHLQPEHGPFWMSPSGGLSTEIKFNISLDKTKYQKLHAAAANTSCIAALASFVLSRCSCKPLHYKVVRCED